MSDFQVLARNRHLLQEFCRYHVPSLLSFQSGPSFRLDPTEKLADAELHHLTSTCTCIESILDCPDQLIPDGSSPDKKMIATEFATRAINRNPESWMSEGSAAIYCRCRALSLVIRYLAGYDSRLGGHLATILTQLHEPDRFAIGETDPGGKKDSWYPPNAFHTYWFLNVYKELSQRFGSEAKQLDSELSIEDRVKAMLLWARAEVGYQIALHAAKSSSRDSDQLAWSLAIIMKFGPDFRSRLSEQDVLREGFNALFSTQTDAGTWIPSKPLFHYPKVGNAYCYVYETFSVLLKIALTQEQGGEFLQTILRPFAPNLIRLWEYARSTKIELAEGKRLIAWSSGHRTNHPSAESWATASVFSFGQALRRLLGIWTRNAALAGLNQQGSLRSAEKAYQAIIEFGDTWPTGAPQAQTVAEQLITLFVNPALKIGSSKQDDPDNQPIQERQARSAILFGPPGTSKTTLARAISECLDWQYVELHASHFVAEGLPAVQRTADGLFQRLMELDHSVVLFDEIDELVRERAMEPDAFGRFLTTSMLPKLAELWKQRKVIYFIATNHIEYFDRAVTRAQRFDALLFVTPPSFARKQARLEKLLRDARPTANVVRIAIGEAEITEVLRKMDCGDHENDGKALGNRPLDDGEALAKFIMLRWDQLDELAYRINALTDERVPELVIDRSLLIQALKAVSDPNLTNRRTYGEFKKGTRYLGRDFSKDLVWEVEGLEPNGVYSPPLAIGNGRVWLTCVDAPVSVSADGYNFETVSCGRVRAIVRTR